MGCNENSVVHLPIFKKKEINNLIFYLQELEKQKQTKSRAGGQK